MSDAVHHHEEDSSRAGGRRAQHWETIVQAMRSTEETPLMAGESSTDWNDAISHNWFPSLLEDDDRTDSWEPPTHHHRYHHYSTRSIRRRLFLLLTEPTTSYASAVFFVILIIAITVSNIIMIMQTMDAWQFTPDDCVSCGGDTSYVFEDDSFVLQKDVPCVCPPAPVASIVKLEDWIVYFFTVEWSLRVLLFEPPPSQRSSTLAKRWCQWAGFLLEPTTVLDALAIFPYFVERFENSNGLLSLRLLRLFRVFQLVRLGQYNYTFRSLTNVLGKSLLYLKLLLVVLAFGAAFFGSMVYWLEKGDWKYHEDTQSYEFLRTSVDGTTDELTPFTSIPVAFWWFLVTATTVGYGDMYPTSTGGMAVAAMAMLTGVLVIAFPVSVFSDLWSQELKKERDNDEDSTDDDTNGEVVSQLGARQVTMTAKDVEALKTNMLAIDQSQKRIRKILAKYDIDA